MANLHKTINELFTGIADAIREKKGSSDLIVADTFPSEIESLRTGFDYNNHDITTLPDYAFYGCEDLNSVDCYNLTSIGANAFENCTNLKTVILYDGVQSVGENAFKGCGNLTIYCMSESQPEGWHENWNPDGCEVVFVTPVKTWDISATENDNVVAKLYNDVNDGYYRLVISGSGDMNEWNISSTAPWYNYRKSIASITIPDSVTSIGDYAFYNCTSLTSINIPDSVTSIGNNAFYGTAYYNNSSNWENDVLYIDNALITAKITISGDYAIKDGTIVIAEQAFWKCTSLTSITIPDSVTSIGNYAFYNCTSLTSINIPDSVTSIGNNAFDDCNALTSVIIPNGITSIGYGVFKYCTSLTSIIIPDSVTSIGDYAFYNCTSLTSINIPDSVTSISNNAFDDTPWLIAKRQENPLVIVNNILINGKTCSDTVIIPNSVTSISNYAFYNCESLTSVNMPDSITSIGDSVFNSCDNLDSITIPYSVTSIGNNAFKFCKSLTSIAYTGTVAQWKTIIFGTNWNYSTPSYIIHCTDGTISKDGTITYY